MGGYVKVAEVGDLSPGGAMKVEVHDHDVALFNVDGTYFAIGDVCTHAGGPLSDGQLEGEVVQCPWHGARFNVCTGEVLGPPAPKGVQCFSVKVEGDDILISPD
jgi:nitrite reductase/ring-hydroxylating ferredoxin subunit